jgi:hypothetical protein
MSRCRPFASGASRLGQWRWLEMVVADMREVEIGRAACLAM